MPASLILDESAVWQFSVFHDGLLDPPANEQKAFELELAVAGIEVVDSIAGCLLVQTTASRLAQALGAHPRWVFQPSRSLAVTAPHRRVRQR